MDNRENNILSVEKLKFEKTITDYLRPLEKKQQRALLWLMYHIGFLEIIASGRIMTNDEETKWRKQAVIDDNYILMALIEYKKLKDQNQI